MNRRKLRGPDHPLFTGRTVTVRGYVRVRCDGHARADENGFVFEHVLVAERALGRALDVRHPVHHVNEDKTDNRPENLIICEDNAYHKLLHVRRRAQIGCGNPNWRKCPFCQRWEAPENLNRADEHPACRRDYTNRRRARA